MTFIEFFSVLWLPEYTFFFTLLTLNKLYCVNSHWKNDMLDQCCSCLLDSPVCKKNIKTEYAVARKEKAFVRCDVDADPPQVSFQWSFNKLTKKKNVISFTNNKTTSVATYAPKSDKDYGVLVCSARNSIGNRTAHCTFHINFAGTFSLLFFCYFNFFSVFSAFCRLKTFQLRSSKLSILHFSFSMPMNCVFFFHFMNNCIEASLILF